MTLIEGLEFGMFSGAVRSSLWDLSGRFLGCTPFVMCLVSNLCAGTVPANTASALN